MRYDGLFQTHWCSVDHSDCDNGFQENDKLLVLYLTLTVVHPCCFQALSPKLADEERKTHLQPLLDEGWTLTEGRDAIYKEFLFKDFNQVSSPAGWSSSWPKTFLHSRRSVS